jgi:hypothetical protein
MTWQDELQDILFSKLLLRRALFGAGIALILITVFILGAISADVKIGSWVFLPMLAVSAGGACGGVFYSLMDLLRVHGGWKKILANVVSVVLYVIGVYLSLILALHALGLWD